MQYADFAAWAILGVSVKAVNHRSASAHLFGRHPAHGSTVHRSAYCAWGYITQKYCGLLRALAIGRRATRICGVGPVIDQLFRARLDAGIVP